jgi:trimethylamine--corrinoid protein Co-methyltransferase
LETYLRVLSEDEKAQVHERTLRVLAKTGAKVDTEIGRQYLKKAGAEVSDDSHIVLFPRDLVEEALASSPKEFSLGARRPGWDLFMNQGDCILMGDGEAITVIDRKTGEHRPSTYQDWLDATRICDALDEVGVYWAMAEPGKSVGSISESVKYWSQLFRNFSKHVQDSSPRSEHSPWLLEVLQVVFGDKKTIRELHPFSFLICPQSPLTIEAQHTDAYLALKGWDIPVAIMPMPLMGGTGPGNMISMTIQGNCEVIAALCLIQAADPGTPVIYAPALAVMNPRTGMYSAGAIEGALLGSAAIEMAQYYRLPVEGSGGGTDTYAPGIQASYERALNLLIPMLSWPDLMIGCGLLGGSMILSLEQLVIDAEVFRMAKQARRGILTTEDMWLDEVIQRVGPGGNYLGEKTTVANVHSGEWLIPSLGTHGTLKAWQEARKKDVLEEAREKVEHILSTHKPLPLGPEREKELDKLQKRAIESSDG